MAFITMRELLRNPTEVFERLGSAAEPFLVTRNGRPVAALLPVDDAHVERLVLAAAPEFLERRREAEHARAEGRTRPFGELLDELDSQSGTETEADPVEFGELTVELSDVFGPAVGQELRQRAVERVKQISRAIAPQVAPADVEDSSGEREELELGDDHASGIRTLTARLFERVMHEVLAEAAAGAVAQPRATPAELAEQALDTATERVQLVNKHLLAIGSQAGRVPLATYEATILGIDAFERVAHVAAPAAVHAVREHA